MPLQLAPKFSGEGFVIWSALHIEWWKNRINVCNLSFVTYVTLYQLSVYW